MGLVLTTERSRRQTGSVVATEHSASDVTPPPASTVPVTVTR